MKPLSFSSVVGEEAMDGFPSFFESERHMVKKKFLYHFKDALAQLEVPFPNPLGILQAIAMDLSIPETCDRDRLPDASGEASSHFGLPVVRTHVTCASIGGMAFVQSGPAYRGESGPLPLALESISVTIVAPTSASLEGHCFQSWPQAIRDSHPKFPKNCAEKVLTITPPITHLFAAII